MCIKGAVALATFIFAFPVLSAPFGSSQTQEDSQNVNLWVCSASPNGHHFLGEEPIYQGYSRMFAAGSGSGQQAKSQALQQAVRNCEWSTSFRCSGRFEECQVSRFQRQ